MTSFSVGIRQKAEANRNHHKKYGEIGTVRTRRYSDINKSSTCKLYLKQLPSNLSIADRLYSEHLVIADAFQWNRSNHDQTLTEKPLYSGHVYSGQLL